MALVPQPTNFLPFFADSPNVRHDVIRMLQGQGCGRPQFNPTHIALCVVMAERLFAISASASGQEKILTASSNESCGQALPKPAGTR
ncbi:hypothetical protein [Mesorhizobium sp. B1-1-5]|uniref:hypothetical protein n=1 Tax=Mesorhizobium sp. B1-1-5 TaxID=2589979 RepID=UPI0011262604|nr:hypothetical protein [Mesorhizobium sp. B1-1-5]TPO10388.1 hypothetical protein FJ980_08795 [Mesorhizobium sp. B1-1-5]